MKGQWTKAQVSVSVKMKFHVAINYIEMKVDAVLFKVKM